MYTTEMEVESFIEEYQRSRVIVGTTVRAIINRALSFETKFDKPFYNFTKEEALEMFVDAHAISHRSLQNSNLVFKHFALWMADAKKIKVINAYMEITKDDLEKCVDATKKQMLILSLEDLKDIMEQLINKVDSGILMMLFLGAGGRWLKELTYLDMSQVSLKNGIVYFKTGKMIPITYDEYEIIKAACSETELMSYGTTARISQVKSHGIFKERFNAKTASDNEHDDVDLERRFRFVQRRLYLISNDLGVKLTSGALQDSGLIWNIKQGMISNNMNFMEYIKTEEAGALAKRYDIYTPLYPQVLREKLAAYF